MSWRLLVIDDHPLFLDGIAAVLRTMNPGMHVFTAGDVARGLAVAEQERLDLVLLDLGLPGVHGFSAIHAFHKQFPSLPVVVLSASERIEDMRGAIAAGALGYIPKSSSAPLLFDALREVMEGAVYLPAAVASQLGYPRSTHSAAVESSRSESLTMRQLEVLAHLCQGLSNKQIAAQLQVAEKTVKTHIGAIFRVLGVVNRIQAVLAARKLGIAVER